MNAAYRELIAASDEDRRELFLATARRLGAAVQNVEKDFWVCWTLDALFNGLATGTPRLLFKGGTSLSKAFGLIDRFSEDVDITVFRDDLGEPASVEELEGLSGKKRKAKLEAIKGACQDFFEGTLLNELAAIVGNAMSAAGASGDRYRVEIDDADPDRQTLLFWYASATSAADSYIRSAVKIEGGAKSALDPHTATAVTPYVAEDLASGDLTVQNITTVDPTRTFWDKVVILHGLRRWFDHRGQLRHGGQRVSRHYYDVFRLLQSDTGKTAEADGSLAEDCARHARMFFNTPDFDLAEATAGTWSLAPTASMMEPLVRDYDAMAGMIMGTIPPFADVIAAVEALESRLNALD